jgi:superfamily II DNA/RNA helicase
MQLIDPAVFGPLWRFNLQFHERDARGKVSLCRNLAALRRTIAPVVLRRRKEEVLTQLPPITEQTRYTPLSDAQAELEQSLRADALKLIRIAERRPLKLEERERIMKLLVKARQACDALELCDPEREERASPKLDEFEALVGEVAAQGASKVLVFSEWTEMLRLAAARLDAMGVTYEMLHGGIPSERRPALLERFRERPDVRVLLSTDAGGVGLNLQVATYVVHLDLPWNPARLDQRTARAHRIGQTRGVSVTYLVSETGIERGIEGTLHQKRAIRQAALDMTSDVDAVEAMSFTRFVGQLRDVLEAAEGGSAPAADDAQVAAPDASADEVVVGEITLDAPPLAARDASLEESPSHATPELAQERAAPSETPEPATSAAPDAVEPFTNDVAPPAVATEITPRVTSRSPRAENRLRLARVVLDAGFPADAVRAAYEALAASIGARVAGGAPETHAALVAAIYRELIPSGMLPLGAHGALAKLHDLAALDAHGVEVDTALAAEAVREASEWIERLG